MTKIVLIGFMGSGKSSVAPLLAEGLGFTFVNTDSLIIERSGFASIPLLFAEKGEAAFRDIESEVAESLRDSEHMVVSTGGGIIGRPSNMEALKHSGGIVVFLKTSFEEIHRRLAEFEDRPLFKNPEQAAALYQTRLPIYQSYADITVTTDGKTPEQVCAEITSRIEARP
jgi:shikimate kinase